MNKEHVFDEEMKKQIEDANDELVAGLLMQGVLDKFTSKNFRHSHYFISLMENTKSLQTDGYISAERAVGVFREVCILFDKSIEHLVSRTADKEAGLGE
jgi:hypothetical protein